MTEFTLMRTNMVNNLLKPNGIRCARIIHAFQEVSRETFLPASLSHNAYNDNNFFAFSELKLLKPLVIAKILQAMNIKVSDKVLIIGSQNLYTAALLTYCCDTIDVACQRKQTYDVLNEQCHQFICHAINIYLDNFIEEPSNTHHYDHIFIEGGILMSSNAILNRLKVNGNVFYLKPLDSYLSYRVIKETLKEDKILICENLFECDGFMLNEFHLPLQSFKL